MDAEGGDDSPCGVVFESQLALCCCWVLCLSEGNVVLLSGAILEAAWGMCQLKVSEVLWNLFYERTIPALASEAAGDHAVKTCCPILCYEL